MHRATQSRGLLAFGVSISAVLALLVGACSSEVSGGGSSSLVSTGAVPYYVPDSVPAGMHLGAVLEIPSGGQDGGGVRVVANQVVVWTDEGAEMPSESSSVLRLDVQVPLDPSAPRRATSVELNPIQTELDGRWHRVNWVEEGGTSAELTGRNVDRETFEQVRDSIVLGPGTEASIQLPPGFREVFQIALEEEEPGSGVMPYVGALEAHPGASGYAQSYVLDGRFPEFAGLSVMTSPPSALWPVISTAIPATLTVRDVQGHTAYELGTAPHDRTLSPEMEAVRAEDPDLVEALVRLGDIVTLVWWDGSGVAFKIMAPSSEDAMTMAESIHEVDQSEWDAFVSSAVGLPELERTTVPLADPAPAPVSPIAPVDPDPSQTTLPRQS